MSTLRRRIDRATAAMELTTETLALPDGRVVRIFDEDIRDMLGEIRAADGERREPTHPLLPAIRAAGVTTGLVGLVTMMDYSVRQHVRRERGGDDAA